MYTNIIGRDRLVKWRKNIPWYVYVSLTNVCNANCIFCDIHKNPLKKNKIDFYKLIDELSEMGSQYVHFMGGGEPFTDPNIDDYIRYISDKGLSIACTTNGYFLNKERVQKLKDCKLSHMFISIDGYDKSIHDNLRRVDGIFERATNAINYLKEANPEIVIVINHVVNKLNIDFIDRMIMLKKRVNFDYLNLLLVKDYPTLDVSSEQREAYIGNIDRYRALAEEVGIKFLEDDLDIFHPRCSGENISCYFPYCSTYVDCPSGDIYPCDCTIHRSQSYCYGNLLESSFTELWNGDKLKELRCQLVKEKMSCKAFCDSANIFTNIELGAQQN